MNTQSLLRYLCPLAFFIILLFTAIIRNCQTSSKPVAVRNGQWIKPFAWGIVITYIAEAAVVVINAAVVTQDDAVHLLSLILLWALAPLIFLQAPWYAGSGAALAVLGFEVGLTVAETALKMPANRCVLATQIIRMILLLGFTLSPTLPGIAGIKASDLETQPLLGKKSDAEDNDDESDSETAFVAKKQQERLEDSQTWWTYLKAYKVFLPFILPKNNIKLQLCLALCLVSLLIQRGLGLLVPRQLGIITNKLMEDHHHVPVKEILTWMLLMYLNSQAGIQLIQDFADRPVKLFSYRNITQAAFNHVMSLSVDFHNDSDSAELITAVNQGQGIGNLVDMFATQLLPEIIDVCIGYIYFYHLFGVYICYIVITAAIIYAYINVKTTNWMREPRREYSRLARKESSTINQAIQGWQTIYFFNRFNLETERVREAVAALQAADWQKFWKSSLGRTVRYLVVDLAFYAASFIAILKISRDEIPLGSFVVLINYWDHLMYPLMGMTYYYSFIQEQLIDAERLLMLLQAKPTVVDREDAKELKVTQGAVSFDKVHFSYDARKPTITDVSFETQPGQTIALVGETGGGKSTIFKLIFRCYDVEQGGIYIDGQNIRDVQHNSLRDALGIVDQSPSLFNISINDNLKYAKLDATTAEIEAACRAAAIHDKILTFPDGYESVVGQRGVKLSGGELQRIAIARVLLKNPKIVLLDEATSAVDTDTEVTIQSALRDLSKGRTTFVIAHRLSTIVSADLVLVIQDGRIIERGTHRELSRREGGKYNSLWSKQVAATVEGIGADEGLTRRVEEVVEGSLVELGAKYKLA